MMEVPPEVRDHAPSVAGALSALLFLRPQSWWRAAGLLLAGWAASVYVAPAAVSWLGGDAYFAGWFTGLFSMAAVAKCFEVVEAVKPGEVLDRALRRWGL